jgi:hypothetical protein
MLEPQLAEKNNKKKQNSVITNPQPIQSFSTPWYTEKMEGSDTARHWHQTCLGDAEQQVMSHGLKKGR